MVPHSFPEKGWTLNDWFVAAGVKNTDDVIKVALAQEVSPIPWSAARIAEWLVDGLPDQTTAVQMIAVLCHIARREGWALFNRDLFLDHANLFLTSKACGRFIPRELTNDEVWDILGQNDDERPAFPVWSFELRRSVYPRPPKHLFGRADEMNDLLTGLESNSVVMVAGVGGEGKTALGWHGAVRVIADQLCHEMAWFTDKRYLIDVSGRRVDIPGTPSDTTFLNDVLRGLARRFRWTEAMGAVDSMLISRCADRLRKGRYLVVVDNLETVEASQSVADALTDMVVRHGAKDALNSRILITSRQRITSTDCVLLQLAGLSIPDSVEYLNHLVAGWQPKHPLTPVQATALAEAAKGNPQLLLVAARRWAQQLDERVIDETVAALTSGRDSVLGLLFDPLLRVLGTEAPVFARLIAQASIAKMELEGNDLHDLYRAAGLSQKINDLLNDLIDNCVISALGGGRFTMHPLVRAYFISAAA